MESLNTSYDLPSSIHFASSCLSASSKGAIVRCGWSPVSYIARTHSDAQFATFPSRTRHGETEVICRPMGNPARGQYQTSARPNTRSILILPSVVRWSALVYWRWDEIAMSLNKPPRHAVSTFPMSSGQGDATVDFFMPCAEASINWSELSLFWKRETSKFEWLLLMTVADFVI